MDIIRRSGPKHKVLRHEGKEQQVYIRGAARESAERPTACFVLVPGKFCRRRAPPPEHRHDHRARSAEICMSRHQERVATVNSP